jgi:uncharacterized coiled-coil DUF342 family protein
MTDNKTLFPATFATEKEEIESLKNDLDEKYDKIIELLEEQKKLRKENKELKEEVDVRKGISEIRHAAHTRVLKRRNWDQRERDRLRKENKKHEDRVKYLEDLVGLGVIEHLEKMRDDPEYAEKCLNDGTA